jgi:exopolyphosphatase/guanosine-5'-triphosphate,3'-diphosphate pyrophosphatase
MKIALLGDIGANLWALEAVLNHAKTHGVTEFLNVGNSLGFAFFPEQTIQRLQMENFTCILGDFDERVLKAKKNLEKLKKTKVPDELIFLNQVHDSLSPESLRYLNSLKKSALLTIQGKKILLTHKPPEAHKVYSLINGEEIIDLQYQNKADIIAFSRQQFPYLKRISDTRFLNTGAVGYAYDTDIWACYTILQFSLGFMKVHPFRIKYDVSGHHSKIRISEIPKALSKTTYPEIITETINQSFFTMQSTAVSSMETSWGEIDNLHRSQMENVKQFMERCINYHTNHHAEQVSLLALELFDQLQPIHHLGEEERYLLEYGSLLHDIGWMSGRKGHHKVAFNIIVNTSSLSFQKRERFIVALLALYHRKSIPNANDLHFASLQPSDRQIVSRLVALLRVADALDSSHQSIITDIECFIYENTVKIYYKAKYPVEIECLAVAKKGQFFEEIFGRKLVTEWKAL